MPNKLITQGYKLFALADCRYIYSFMWSSRKQGLDELIKHSKLTPTGSIVLELVQKLLNRYTQSYTVYLDNYFTSISLFEQLRDINIGVCGTTRAHAAGDDYPALIKELWSDFAKKLPWNTIVVFVVYSNKVLALFWQDNNVIIALSTVHIVDKAIDLIERECVTVPSRTERLAESRD
jgi:Transposase IS4